MSFDDDKDGEKSKKRVQAAPIVPYFIAAATGICVDFAANPGGAFWAVWLVLSVAAVGGDWALSFWKKSAKNETPENCKAAKETQETEEKGNAQVSEIAQEVIAPVNEAKPRISQEPEESKKSEEDAARAATFWANWLAERDASNVKKRDAAEPDESWNAALFRFLTKNRPDAGAFFENRFDSVRRESVSSENVASADDEDDRETRKIAEIFANLDFEGFSALSPFAEEFSVAENKKDGEDNEDAEDWRFASPGNRKRAAKNGFAARFGALLLEFCRFVAASKGNWTRRAFRAVARRSVWRAAWTLTAVAALSGYRHYSYFNVFPENEIGFVVPANGTAATLDLRLIGTPILYRAEKTSNPLFAETETTAFVAEVTRAKNRGVWEDFSGSVAVSVSGDATFLRIGDEIRVSGRLAPPTKVGNPGERDRRYNYRSRRILTTLSVDGAENVELLPTERFSVGFRIARALETVRLSVAETYRRELSPRSAAVACGMTLGFRNEIDETTNDAFLKTGTIHLLSISGLHIALVVGAFCGLLRILRVSERWTCVAALGLVAFYLGLTDLRTPVLRAGILVTVICCAVLLRRRALSLNALAATALALLFWNPCELFQLGAQLSFLATGVFLWANRANLLERAEAATTRRQALLERRRLMQSGVKDGESDAEKNVLARFFAKFWPKKGATNGADLTEENADANDDGSPETETEAPPDDWKSRLRRSLRSTARRVGRSATAKGWALTKTGALIWGVGTPLILRSANLFAPIAILANVAIWAPATFALISALTFGAFGAAANACGFGGSGDNAGVFNGCVGWAISIWAAATDCAFDVFLGTLDLLSGSNFGAFRVAELGNWALWAFYLPLIFWTLFPKRRPTRRTLARALALWLAAVLVVDVAARWDANRRDLFRADVLSVGHGVATILYFPDGRTALVDCGSISSAERVADLVAKNLWNAGRNRLDVVLISHADYDHYSGLEPLDESIEIGRVCVSPATFQKENDELTALKTALERRGAPIETVVGGETLARFGFPEISILHPTPGRDGTIGAESNENSLVVAVERRGRLLMFPGDLDAPDAEFLAAKPTRFDLTLAPHHGGKSENYRGLLDWARPTWVVVSGGSFQRNLETEKDLRDEGFRVLHTLDDGCVRIEIERDPNGDENALGKMTVRTFRSERFFESGDF